jgi:hypothetical protein
MVLESTYEKEPKRVQKHLLEIMSKKAYKSVQNPSLQETNEPLPDHYLTRSLPKYHPPKNT